MALRTPDSKQEQDSAHNPYQHHYEDQFGGDGSSSTADDLQDLEENAANTPNQDDVDQGIDDLEKYANNPGYSSQKTKEREEESGWKNNVSGKSSSGGNEKSSISGKLSGLKKKGPLGFILALLFGGGGILTILFSPGMALVNLKEVLMNDLDDQLATMNLRSDALLRSKLKGLQSGVCTNKVSIKCKFTTMSKKEVERFKKAGFVLEPEEPDRRFGRTKPTSITFPDGTKVNNPTELRNHLNKSAAARSATHKAFNPKFAGYATTISNSIMDRFKSSKTQKIKGDTDEERDKNVTKATSGNGAGQARTPSVVEDEDGRRYIQEGDERVYEDTEPDRFNEIQERYGNIADGVGNEGNKVSNFLGSTAGSVARGVSVLGAADTACTVYNFGRAVAAAAKAARALQLFQFAMVYLNLADRIKDGVATPEEATWAGDKLTAVDTNETVLDESGVTGIDADGNVQAEERPNPYYMANAFDAAGFRAAAHNEAPVMSSRDMQFSVGGGLTGTFSSVMDNISSVLGGRGAIASTCEVVQSWWARAGGLVAGLVVGGLTLGVGTAVSIGASVAIGMAMPFFEAALADILAGTVVSADTVGPDAGNAMFSGTAAVTSSIGMGHGMIPASKNEMGEYIAATADTRSQIIATETYEAKDEPFNIYNEHSFMGSAVRQISPTIFASSASLSSALTSLPSLITSSFASINSSAGAYQKFNPARYDRCNDIGYEEIGIQGDVMCNVRMHAVGLGIDPESATDWLLQRDHITEEGEPDSDEFKDWVTYCTKREGGEAGMIGWGEPTSDEPTDYDKEIGKECVTNLEAGTPEQAERVKYFSTFWQYKIMQETMDEGYQTGHNGGAGGGGEEVSGDAKQLAAQVANNPNIRFVDQQTKEQLLKFSRGEPVTNSCGKPFAIGAEMLGALQKNSQKYSVLINNIGFREDRSMCDGGQHPKGNAVDLNDIQILGGAGTGGSIRLPGDDVPIVNQYASDFLAALPCNRGGVGQSNVGINPTKPPCSQATTFSDAGNHLHIDAREH